MATQGLENEWFNMCENINGNDINIFHEPPPTQGESHDILKAVSTIGKYTDNMNDPITHKINVILGTFARQLCLDETRTMKNSVSTDFFNRT